MSSTAWPRTRKERFPVSISTSPTTMCSAREWFSFFGMLASFDTPFEVTTSELAIELLFPADRATAEAFKKGAP